MLFIQDIIQEKNQQNLEKIEIICKINYNNKQKYMDLLR